jgi:NAD(P)-dependent dehydrogenase (short-subunit alcohol dehydrogenase family)
MGAATAGLLVELGAEVHTLDVKKPDITGLASYTECDLREPEQIEAAVERIGKVVNALFNCAGLPSMCPELDVMLVNFCGVRHLTERVVPNLLEGGAIVSIASTAGSGWRQNLGTLMPLLATDGFHAARAWCEDHPQELVNAYGLSKEAINAYTAFRSFALAPHGIRINCVNPGPTDAPIPLGRRAAAEEQAWPLVFLNSPRASYVTGGTFAVDGGFTGGLLTGQIDPSVLMPER